jgi:hypothetical protein
MLDSPSLPDLTPAKCDAREGEGGKGKAEEGQNRE